MKNKDVRLYDLLMLLTYKNYDMLPKKILYRDELYDLNITWNEYVCHDHDATCLFSEMYDIDINEFREMCDRLDKLCGKTATILKEKEYENN